MTEIIEQFKALPANERAQVAKFVVEHDDSWIPEAFKDDMAEADAEAGRLVDLNTALNERYGGHRLARPLPLRDNSLYHHSCSFACYAVVPRLRDEGGCLKGEECFGESAPFDRAQDKLHQQREARSAIQHPRNPRFIPQKTKRREDFHPPGALC